MSPYEELLLENLALKRQLNATYGCESCPGMPILHLSREVSLAAFKAALFDCQEAQNLTLEDFPE